ncbi:MAG: PAS domain S-box protein [Gemmatimonadales bacterium]|nr:PAS domain S-box protein [Gemmatimonadales bacterium]
MSVINSNPNRELDILQRQLEIIREVHTCPDPLQMLNGVLLKMLDIQGIDGIWTWFEESDQGQWRLTTSQGISQDLVNHITVLPDQSPLSDQLHMGNEVVGVWRKTWDEYGLPLENDGWVDVGIFPIRAENSTVGAVAVGSRTGSLSPGLKIMLRSLAACLGGRLSRDRLAAFLANSRHNLDTLFTTFEDRVFVVDHNGLILHTNSGNPKRLPLSRMEVVGREITEVMPAFPTLIQVLEKSGKNLDCPGKDNSRCQGQRSHLIGEGGAKVSVEVRICRGLWNDQNVYYLLCRDVSRQLAQEKETEQLSVAMAHLAEAIIITNSEGAIQYINPAFSLMTGYSQDEVLGKNPRILKSGKHSSGFYRQMWDTLTSGETWSGRLENRKKDGALILEEAHISPVLDGDGVITHFVCVKRDVSTEVALEQKLRESQKLEAVGTLAGGLAHDFNNILYALMGYTQLALEDLEENDPVHTYLGEISKAGERATDLVAKMLTFGQRASTTIKEIRIQEIVGEALDLARASLPATIEFRIDMAEDCPTVKADATQIHQVILNLCTNADHAMRQGGGELSVSLEAVDLDLKAADKWPKLSPGQWGVLKVSDTGSGMNTAVVDRIFEPYFTTKKSDEGTGLGLATVHGIISNHGGRIYVDSSLGEGTTFTIFLPLSGQTVKVDQEEAPNSEVGGGGKVLLVDDEEMIVDVAVKGLTRLGFEVVGLMDGVQAVELFRQDPNSFDVVVTDQTMPGITGFEVATKILAIRPDLPVILTTGYSNILDEEKVKEAGICRLLQKPLKIRELAEALDELTSVSAAN